MRSQVPLLFQHGHQLRRHLGHALLWRAKLEVLQHEKRGSVMSIVARGTKQEILMTIQEKNPILAEILPLTLEEIFISETEVAGYDIKRLVF